jgi:hypothetical protein
MKSLRLRKNGNIKEEFRINKIKIKNQESKRKGADLQK